MTMDAKELRANAERCGKLARGCTDESIASEFRSLAKEFLAQAREVATVVAFEGPPHRRIRQG